MSFCSFLRLFLLFLLTTLGKDHSCWVVYSVVAVVQHDDGPEVFRIVIVSIRDLAFLVWMVCARFPGCRSTGTIGVSGGPDREGISEIGRTMWVLSGVSRARVHLKHAVGWCGRSGRRDDPAVQRRWTTSVYEDAHPVFCR